MHTTDTGVMQSTGATRPLTFGEKAVGLTFNPDGSLQVTAIKAAYAAIIDQLNDLKNSPLSEGMINSDERNELISIAITEAQTAQMWAVKAITWQ